MPLYFGVGGRMVLRDNKDDRFGVRVPVGVSYRFIDPEFLELFRQQLALGSMSSRSAKRWRMASTDMPMTGSFSE